MYTGSWVAGEKSGYGVLEHKNGARYEGEWLNVTQFRGSFHGFPEVKDYRGPERNLQSE